MQIGKLEKKYINKEYISLKGDSAEEILLGIETLKLPINDCQDMGIIFLTNYDNFNQKVKFLCGKKVSYLKRKLLFNMTSNNFLITKVAKKLKITGPIFNLFKSTINENDELELAEDIVNFYRKPFLLVLMKEKGIVIECIYFLLSR